MAKTIPKLANLSARERQIAEAYAAGRSYREIAERLFIAPTTVRTHLGTIYRKLGVSSKIELLKELERRAASSADASPECLHPEAEHVAARSRDGRWAVSEAGLGTARHGLPARVDRLREDALLALADGILESEQVEPSPQASEAPFRAIIETLPAVILLKDRALRYVFVNRFFLGQWGLRPESVIGRTQQEVFSGGLGFAWSRATDDRDARVLQSGQGTGFYVVRVPVEVGRDRVLWARKLPVRNEEGAISRVLTLGIDITPLERMPEEMSARLPSADVPLPAAIAARLPRAKARARILMVDAEPEVRQLAVEALEQIGHTVETAASGCEALAILAMRPVDLIVSDIGMSDLDGLGLQYVLAARRPELLERIIFTAPSSLSAVLQNFVCGGRLEVLQKPFAAKDIVARIEAKLASTSGAHLER